MSEFLNLKRLMTVGLAVLLGLPAQGQLSKAGSNRCETVVLGSTDSPKEEAGLDSFESKLSDPEFRQEISKLAERNAISVIDNAALSKQKALEEVHAWLERIVDQQESGESLDIAEHIALVYLLKTDFFNKFGTPDMTEVLKDQLILSRKRLTGESVTEDDLDKKLPLRLMVGALPETRVFYSAVFREGGPSRQSLKDVLKGYVPTRSDIAFGFGALSMTAIAFAHSGGDKIAAAMMGFAVATVAEHVFHRYGTHSQVLMEKTKNSWFGKTIQNLFFNHSVVHHGKTFHNYTDQFKSDDHHDKVDEQILEKMGQDYLDNMQKNEYGITLTSKEYIGLLLPLMPVHAVLCSLMGLDPISTALFIAPTLLYPAGVVIPHRYMHMTRAEIAQATLNKPLTRWFLKTRYAGLMSAIHHNHHRDANTNFNLAFIAGDMLFGTLKMPSVADIARMRRLGILGTTWGSATFEGR